MQGCGPNKLAPALFAKTMITEAYKTFTEAVDLEWSVPTAGTWSAVMLSFKEAPFNHESGGDVGEIQVIFRSQHGADYDTILFTRNPAGSRTIPDANPSDPAEQRRLPVGEPLDIYIAPDIEVPLSRGDSIAVVYTNPELPNGSDFTNTKNASITTTARDRTVAITIKGNDSVR